MKRLTFNATIKVDAADENETHEEALEFLQKYFDEIFGNWSVNGSESVTFHNITPADSLNS